MCLDVMWRHCMFEEACNFMCLTCVQSVFQHNRARDTSTCRNLLLSLWKLLVMILVQKIIAVMIQSHYLKLATEIWCSVQRAQFLCSLFASFFCSVCLVFLAVGILFCIPLLFGSLRWFFCVLSPLPCGVCIFEP